MQDVEEHDPQDGEEYIPSTEEIRRECLAIQSEWTPAQEAQRQLWGPLASQYVGEEEALDRVTRWKPPGSRHLHFH